MARLKHWRLTTVAKTNTDVLDIEDFDIDALPKHTRNGRSTWVPNPEMLANVSKRLSTKGSFISRVAYTGTDDKTAYAVAIKAGRKMLRYAMAYAATVEGKTATLGLLNEDASEWITDPTSNVPARFIVRLATKRERKAKAETPAA